MRLTLVLAMSLLSCMARADTFQMNFVPEFDSFPQSGLLLPAPNNFTMPLSGSFMTDGLCTICEISQVAGGTVVSSGILGALVMNGTHPWLDLNNPFLFYPDLEQGGGATYNRSTGAFSLNGYDVGNRISLFWDGVNGSYSANATETVIETGTFSVSPAPVPEPNSFALLATMLAAAAIRTRATKRP